MDAVIALPGLFASLADHLELSVAFGDVPLLIAICALVLVTGQPRIRRSRHDLRDGDRGACCCAGMGSLNLQRAF